MEPIENVKKADRPRYWLTFLFKDLDVGEAFKPDVLHLTIIPWFVTELPDDQVIKSFKQFFSGQKALEIKVGEQGEFKNKRRIPVNFVEPSSQITELHQKVLDWFSQLDARWAVKSPHVADEFMPHIRRRKGRNFSQTEKIKLDSLSLVSAYRHGDDLRTVTAKVKFNEK
jgi:2'-5' RNA ligase